MTTHVFMVLTNPVAGRDADYNSWYTDKHLPDVLKIPGIVAAQRFKLSGPQRAKPPFPWGYLAIYHIDTDDLTETVEALNAAAGTDAMVLSDALHADRLALFFEPITPLVERG